MCHKSIDMTSREEHGSWYMAGSVLVYVSGIEVRESLRHGCLDGGWLLVKHWRGFLAVELVE